MEDLAVPEGGRDGLMQRRLRLAQFQLFLPHRRRHRQVGSRLDFRLFQKIAPAFVPVFRTLAQLKLLDRGFRVRLALNHVDDSRRHIRSHVMADDSVKSLSFIARQSHRYAAFRRTLFQELFFEKLKLYRKACPRAVFHAGTQLRKLEFRAAERSQPASLSAPS